ncbi:flavodoxin reductase family protein [Synechococcus sp. PCC 7502]|uniref:2Fe-2S iron-sulfur cluster-binding protein n=1 Tax=Synechococcus sp. PCC 7502 TaxID=1173263 RepID=UPI00029FD246|nr:2Fe-2S iron-sulfur cluster-binding protein [Synechococcus sp. PCC 7502]AFY75096.1 flavodoxin reductase family protein [Synechococcus sp. PCC 7502]
MLEDIKQISNPFLRAIAAGFFLSSLVTIPLTAILFFVNPKNEDWQKYIVWASLASAGIGAGTGLIVKSELSQPQTKESSEQESVVTKIESEVIVWQDWREFKVNRKVKESDGITSFYLIPNDGESIPNFIPGQFLTIKLDIPDQSKPAIRTYSLSDYSQPPKYYRLSIKREPAPSDMIVPPGIASNFMHDHIQEGSIILAKPPTGKFIIDVNSSNPAILISNGVGITPMISMVKAISLLNPSRHIWFLHGARDGSSHAFREEIGAIAAINPNLHVIYCYSQPKENDLDRYHHKGYVDVALIKEMVAPEIMEKLYGSTQAEYYLCGSPSFMDSLRDGLREWGVPDSKVLFESFTKILPKQEQPLRDMNSGKGKGSDPVEVVFNKSGKTLNWHPDDGSILELAEANDIYPDYSCRAGICGTCMCGIIEGEVIYKEPPTAFIDEGSVLICVSTPKTSRVVLDI